MGSESAKLRSAGTLPRVREHFAADLAALLKPLSRRRRRQFVFAIGLSLIAAFAELATIGAVLPFLSLLASPDTLARFPLVTELFETVGATGGRERLVAATALLSLLAIVTALVRLLLVRFNQRFMFELSHELSVDIQRRILLQPYAFHIGQNSSRILAALEKVQALVHSVLLPILQALTAGFIALVIIAALALLEPLMTLAAAVVFSLIYWLVSLVTRPRLARNSQALGSAWDERVKIVQENLGGIRDVILENSQMIRLDAFERVDRRFSLAQSNTAIIAAAPRFVIEAAGMIFIAAVALIISGREGSLAAALPVLGALALGAQRILPLIQQIYFSSTVVAGHRSVVTEVLDLLRLPADPRQCQPERVDPLPLNDRIRIENVSFAYPARARPALEGVTLEIERGSAVAIVGETGSGKSTFADLLMGLLEPDRGRIAIDGDPLSSQNRRRWQRSIAHVPQAIFLADASIAANIAFAAAPDGVDRDRIAAAATSARIHDFILSLPDGYDTRVGERGVRLSGGQRQRLAIARAIYRQAPVIVLDEATNALDEATESAVMETIAALKREGRTIVAIGHRLPDTALYDRIVRIEAGRIVDSGGGERALNR